MNARGLGVCRHARRQSAVFRRTQHLVPDHDGGDVADDQRKHAEHSEKEYDVRQREAVDDVQGEDAETGSLSKD